jgi:pimeloyl-ACP methyl ester carboxylesterase
VRGPAVGCKVRWRMMSWPLDQGIFTEVGVMDETDLQLDEGGSLHVYDTGAGPSLTVFWHHGTPNIGAPPTPLLAASERLGIRWLSYDRPGYGGSSPRPGRDLASAATYVRAVADTFGIDSFAVMGHSGGAPHALACAALLPGRVVGVVSIASLAPYDADGLDWFAGMASSGVASLRAAVAGREAKERHEAEHGDDYDPEFTPADMTALSGSWAWVLDVVRPAAAQGPAPAIDDDLAYVGQWGFDPSQVQAPALFLHGGLDRLVPASHSQWLADRCPTAEHRLFPEDGHVSVLTRAEGALEWLAEHARG